MQFKSATFTRFAPLGLVAVLLGPGCSPMTRYYMLSPVDGAAPAAAGRTASASKPVLIAVGPVSLPDYVDRPQIVVRTSANTVEQAPFDQWGGSLDDMVPQLLVANLAGRLPGAHFVAFPQAGDMAFDYRVPITVSQFDVSTSGEAVLAANWQVRGPAAEGTLAMRRSVVRVQATGPGYSGRVAALSGAVGALTDEISEVLATLTAAGAKR